MMTFGERQPQRATARGLAWEIAPTISYSMSGQLFMVAPVNSKPCASSFEMKCEGRYFLLAI
ncbi:MAG: hypothetical protein DRR19_04795 [Candidatus Parabeggiatoa sp. nov. 1]|nr:MAG: hypothetical protein DRR19_04795 [Gammaproteobacteria bacterium]